MTGAADIIGMLQYNIENAVHKQIIENKILCFLKNIIITSLYKIFTEIYYFTNGLKVT